MARFLMRTYGRRSQLCGWGRRVLVALFTADLAGTEMVARRLEKAGAERGPVSFSLGWAARRGRGALEETVNRADRQLIQVRVVNRPGAYTRRTPNPRGERNLGR